MRNNTPAIINSTELSGAIAKETITVSYVTSPEPQIVTINSDSNEPTIPYGFSNQHPIVPPSLNGLNLPHNPFNVLPAMAVVRADEEYSPQSPEPSIPVSSFVAPNECEYHWRLGDNAHNRRWSHVLYWQWAQTSLLGYFFDWQLWLQRAKSCLYCFEPILHTAASTKTKKESEHGDVFS